MAQLIRGFFPLRLLGLIVTIQTPMPTLDNRAGLLHKEGMGAMIITVTPYSLRLLPVITLVIFLRVSLPVLP
jgi:hypothetical protein